MTNKKRTSAKSRVFKAGAWSVCNRKTKDYRNTRALRGTNTCMTNFSFFPRNKLEFKENSAYIPASFLYYRIYHMT